MTTVQPKERKNERRSSGLGSSVGCASDWYSGGRGFDPPVWQHSFVEIGHEISATAIFSLPLFQVRQLSFTGERMCTKYWLSRPVSLFDRIDMALVVDGDVKTHSNIQIVRMNE